MQELRTDRVLRQSGWSVWVVVLSLNGAGLLACTGDATLESMLPGGSGGHGADPDSTAHDGGAPTTEVPVVAPPPILAVGDAPLRRLTPLEYTQTVNELFGLELNTAEAWPASGTSTGFSGDVSGQGATADLVDQVLRSAERVADAVVARLSSLHPCATAAGAEPLACADAFIDHFARRAYRRPLTSEDREHLRAALQWSLDRGNTLPQALRLVTVVMLQSPHFLYRPELEGDEVVLEGRPFVRLSDHELATRLSFLLTAAAPDQMLLDAADRGELRTNEQLLAQATRLLESQRGRASVQRFFEEWFHLDRMDATTKNAEHFPEFTPAMRAALKAGTLARFEDLVFGERPGDIAELLGGRHSFVNQHTAPLLGIHDVSGEALQRVEIADHPRAGLLTDLGMMSMLSNTFETSPVARGLFVWEYLLCQSVPPPPPDLNVEPPLPDPTLTTRQRFAAHRENKVCASCHQFFDPPGFALENYDPLGRYRSEENGLPIDATGSMPLGSTVASFDGAHALAALLSQTDLPKKCLTQKWFSFAMGRPNGVDDAYSMHALHALPSQTPIRAILLALVQTPSFTHRPSTTLEACTP